MLSRDLGFDCDYASSGPDFQTTNPDLPNLDEELLPKIQIKLDALTTELESD